VGAGVDAVFLEVHDRPETARSDAQNAFPLERLARLLDRLRRIDEVVKERPDPVPATRSHANGV
jgi:2-dehydro-3-deoxyphosphooctonate aldolase (KDO 8-P synthase)